MAEALNLLVAAAREDRRHQIENKRRLRDVYDPADIPEYLFKRRYRLSKECFFNLCHDLEALELVSAPQKNTFAIKILAVLSFLAHGSYQQAVGTGRVLSQPTVSRYISEVVKALSDERMTSRWVNFPITQEARNATRNQFYEKFRIPGVIGCVDGTHIAIIKPSEKQECFYNRKRYHSINTQIICDSNLKIISVFANNPGATHDARIWEQSYASRFMKQTYESGERVWILGDSGYPLRPWLMTPCRDPLEGSPESQYNKIHCSARCTVERCIGVLKGRWRCLLKHRTLHYTPEVACRIIIACSVLHNIAVEANLPEPEVIEGEEDMIPEGISEENGIQSGDEHLLNGRLVRNQLVRSITG